MEWIDPDHEVRDVNQLEKEIPILTNLDEVHPDTSMYTTSLLDQVTDKDLYIMTKKGKAYPGSTVKCRQTKQKDKIIPGSINILVDYEREIFQFVATFKDNTKIDARGHYAQNQLDVIQRRGNNK